MNLRALVVCALAGLLLAGCASTSARTLNGCGSTCRVLAATSTPAPTHILFVGDSLTVGFAATTAAQSYAEIVVATLHGVRINDSAQYGISALGVAQNFAITLPPSGSDDIVVELGTNDGESPADFSTAYGQLLADLRQLNPTAHFVCVSPWQDPTSGNQSVNWASIQSACRQQHGSAVDIYPFFLNNSFHGPSGATTFLTGTRGFPDVRDSFHPNDAGHAAIAQAVLAALASIS
jgi:acyl-CoA thioesterase-1